MVHWFSNFFFTELLFHAILYILQINKMIYVHYINIFFCTYCLWMLTNFLIKAVCIALPLAWEDKNIHMMYIYPMCHYESSLTSNCCDMFVFLSKVFLEAIQSPSPAFRYFTSGVVPPLTQLKITDPDGSQCIRAMSKIIFSAEENWLPHLAHASLCFICRLCLPLL